MYRLAKLFERPSYTCDSHAITIAYLYASP